LLEAHLVVFVEEDAFFVGLADVEDGGEWHG
jgi:hypothetical protein